MKQWEIVLGGLEFGIGFSIAAGIVVFCIETIRDWWRRQ